MKTMWKNDMEKIFTFKFIVQLLCIASGTFIFLKMLIRLETLFSEDASFGFVLGLIVMAALFGILKLIGSLCNKFTKR